MMTKLIQSISEFFLRLSASLEKKQSEWILGAIRSSGWRKFRADQMIVRGGKCECCGGTTVLELHHIEPFHKNPVRELDPINVMILCESGKNGLVCHRAIGHLGNYQSINETAMIDARYFGEKIQNRP